MKILVVGNGGREHCLVWKIAQSKYVDRIYTAPGNPGTAEYGENVDIDGLDIDNLLKFALEKEIDLTFVGPEAPLVGGIVDRFQGAGLKAFGPVKNAAILEGSKVFAKGFMKKYGIPTAEYKVFNNAEEALEYIKDKGAPIVVKAEGLAAGKGVVVAKELSTAVEAVESMLIEKKFGSSGQRIVVEEYLEGEEATVLAFVDGKTIVPMIASQDHKQAYDEDRGPNTGGMGAYAPAPLVDEKMMEKVKREILFPTLEGLKSEGIDYKGVLYTGILIKDGSPKVIEYNVRFGDPEAQVVLPLLKTDLVEIALAVIEGSLSELEIEWFDKKALCVIMASGGYPMEYEKGKLISGIDKVDGRDDLLVFQAGTKLVDGELYTDGGRVLAVTAIGSSFMEVIEKAYSGVEKIYFPDFHIRHDIGHKALKYI
ncbi:MAG: phosphoribosylamine--glycine ligase [Halanaerobiaceae bacterium]|nr:phosphoribosylamine--glycine ligase [Halanaerobiaceae bacterium]